MGGAKLSTGVAALNNRLTAEIASLDHRFTAEVAAFHNRLASEVATLDQRIAIESPGRNAEIVKLDGDVALLKWMVGFSRAMLVTPLFRSFTH